MPTSLLPWQVARKKAAGHDPSGNTLGSAAGLRDTRTGEAGRLDYLTPAVVYYTIKALALLLATVVGIFTKDKERGQRCVQIVQALSRGWPWPPRQPDAPA
jgi:hypothetical protein